MVNIIKLDKGDRMGKLIELKNDITNIENDIIDNFNKTDIKRVKEIEKKINNLKSVQEKCIESIDKYNSCTIQIKNLINELKDIKNKYE